jgi:hypothetical protein
MASFIDEVQASTYNSKNHGPAALQQKSKRGKLQENLHRSNLQADSIIPTRKESHSSKCTILAVKLNTLSSIMDICFIKPQDLLALSIAICAWRLDKVKRLSRSAILEEYSLHWQTGRGGNKTPESKASAEDGARPRPDNLPARTGWKAKEKEEMNNSEAKPNTIFHKRGYIYKSISPMTKVLGLHATREFATSKRKENYKGGQVYATSASRSVAEEGIAEAAPASGGGIDPLVAGVEEIGIVLVAEATKGEIIDTMPGAYFFAFSKKGFSSKQGRPGEELTFSQFTSSPCAYANAMAPSAPRFKERPFIVRMGSSSVSKDLARFFKSGTSAFFLGHNPTKIHVRTRLTNSKISWTDIQFASSKLSAAKRGSLSGCKVDADTPLYSAKPRKQQAAEREYISKHNRARKPTR